MAKLLDGKKLSLQFQETIRKEIVDLNRKRPPKLVAVLVGDEKASATYVKNKARACKRAGLDSEILNFDYNITMEEMTKKIHKLNNDPSVDGFIVQLPLPQHLSPVNITLNISPEKDVDGFHPENYGKVLQGIPAFIPATPYGILLLLKHYRIETEGRHCVIVGRSNIVGTPISVLLSRKSYPGNCTVTLTHSRTKDLKKITRQADILISAIGIPEFIDSDMVKEGAVCIDVGINAIKSPSRKKGYRLVGDMEFNSVSKKVSSITPVPGGVGPMTVTGLLMNTLHAYKGTYR